MAAQDTTLDDSAVNSVSVRVGFSSEDVDSITDPVTINFMITAGEMCKAGMLGSQKISSL